MLEVLSMRLLRAHAPDNATGFFLRLVQIEVHHALMCTAIERATDLADAGKLSEAKQCLLAYDAATAVARGIEIEFDSTYYHLPPNARRDIANLCSRTYAAVNAGQTYRYSLGRVQQGGQKMAKYVTKWTRMIGECSPMTRLTKQRSRR